MRALSIRAPWAYAIIHLGKDVENRSWATKIRGRFLVHASATKDIDAWEQCQAMAKRVGKSLPPPASIFHGGFIGTVELTDCGRFVTSPWWIGPHGFKLANPQSLPFIPYKARLQFFQVPDEVLTAPVQRLPHFGWGCPYCTAGNGEACAPMCPHPSAVPT